MQQIAGWFSSWLLSPWLLAAGAVLVAAPIIIHLLNRRKFRQVDWAAMEFLLDADQRNRRRLQLENLLLLLLRCLAVLMLGLMLARPFSCTGVGRKLVDAPRFERIVLLDDSLSMKLRRGNQTVMDSAKDSLAELIRRLADNDSEDSLTLMITSHPGQRILNGAPIDEGTIDRALDALADVAATDQTAALEESLAQIEQQVTAPGDNIGRVVYVISDLRNRDWRIRQDVAEDEQSPLAALRRISDQADACFLVDADADNSASPNLTVVAIKPEDTLVAGVLSRFDVTVANLGDREVRGARLEFTPGEATPMSSDIDVLGAKQTITLPFSFEFAAPPPEEGAETEESNTALQAKVRAEVFAANPADADRLLEDNLRYFPARVVRGISVLIYDGDPSAIYARGESFYLARALAPPGGWASGISVTVANEGDFENERLDQYQVIVLCNVQRLSAHRLKALKQWVKAGGGLILAPGDQVDEATFNQQFGGTDPLSPIVLEQFAGDESEATWKLLEDIDEPHPSLRVFQGQNNPLLARVKIFRWWQSTLAEAVPGKKKPLSGSLNLLARINSDDHSPAIVEHRYGKGRVTALAFPLDSAWSNWPDEPSYLIAMQELVRYLAPSTADAGQMRVGQPLVQSIDLAAHQVNASLAKPGGAKSNVQASSAAGTDSATESEDAGDNMAAQRPNRDWRIEYSQTDQQGFYELQLKRNAGGIDELLFAANVDPAESDLRRVNMVALGDALTDSGIVLTSTANVASSTVDSSNTQWWKIVLLLLAGVLVAEQLLGWLFGRKR